MLSLALAAIAALVIAWAVDADENFVAVSATAVTRRFGSGEVGIDPRHLRSRAQPPFRTQSGRGAQLLLDAQALDDHSIPAEREKSKAAGKAEKVQAKADKKMAEEVSPDAPQADDL